VLRRVDDRHACAWELVNDEATRDATSDRHTCKRNPADDRVTRDERPVWESMLT
jgi:hypothetical protein